MLQVTVSRWEMARCLSGAGKVQHVFEYISMSSYDSNHWEVQILGLTKAMVLKFTFAVGGQK